MGMLLRKDLLLRALMFEEASLSVFRHRAILITAVPQKDRFGTFQ